MTETPAPLKRGAAAAGFELVFTAALPLFSLLFIWQAAKISEPPRNVMVGPRTFPYVVGIVLLIISVCLVWNLLRRPAGQPEETQEAIPLEEDETAISDWPAVWVVLGSLLACIALLELLGFVVAISLFLFGLTTFFSPRHWLRNLIVAITFSTFFFSLFTYVLGIGLPEGEILASMMTGSG